MPWTASDAPQHTHKADTERLRDLWARVANATLERGLDDGAAVREANAAVDQAKRKGRFV